MSRIVEMVLQNRVRPDGEIIAVRERGMLMGNRGGRMHDAECRLGSRRWCSKAWISCRLSFNERRRQVMGDGYTELFFLDEATALAAGHRPCFECRRDDAVRFATLWNRSLGLDGRARAGEMDHTLHRERLPSGGGRRMHRMRADQIPDGAMLLCHGRCCLWHSARLWEWTAGGYRPHDPVTVQGADVLTPPAALGVLRAGYRPIIHASASVG